MSYFLPSLQLFLQSSRTSLSSSCLCGKGNRGRGGLDCYQLMMSWWFKLLANVGHNFFQWRNFSCNERNDWLVTWMQGGFYSEDIPRIDWSNIQPIIDCHYEKYKERNPSRQVSLYMLHRSTANNPMTLWAPFTRKASKSSPKKIPPIPSPTRSFFRTECPQKRNSPLCYDLVRGHKS